MRQLFQLFIASLAIALSAGSIPNKHLLNKMNHMSTNAQLLETSLAVWSNQYSDERLQVMKKIYAPDIHFFETDSGAPYVGFEAINALISKLQSQWPVGSRFVLTEPSKVNHSLQQASWILGPPGAKPIVTGMDVAVIENGLIKSLYLFMK